MISPLQVQDIYRKEAVIAKWLQDLTKLHGDFLGLRENALEKIEEHKKKIEDHSGDVKIHRQEMKAIQNEIRKHSEAMDVYKEEMQKLSGILQTYFANYNASLSREISRIRSTVTKGDKGKDGKDAITPLKGVHYFTDNDIKEIVKKVAEEINSTKNSDQSILKPEHLLHLFTRLPKGKRLKYSDIDGLEQTMSAFSHQLGNGYLHGGGGDSYSAGSGISISTVGGIKVISTTGVGGISVFGEIPTGSGTTFTLAHTPASTISLYRGGARQRAGVGNDYTLSGATITLAVALETGELLECDYNY